MSVSTLVLLGIAAALAVYAVAIYNGLVSLKHGVSKSWANIDVLLKQRHDELPKLVETCSQYMRYEQETLKRVMDARSAVADARAVGDLASLGTAENRLRGGLARLFAVAEAYPDLKANQTFQHLQSRITDLENSIAGRRELYNENVNANNIRIEQFPDVILARAFGFGPAQLLEFSDEEKSDISIRKLFG